MGGEVPVVFTDLGHGLHALVVFGGIVGVVLLLAPQLRRPQPTSGAHELRVALLRERVAAGSLATLEPPPTRVETDPEPRRTRAIPEGTTALLVAAVASAAAAGVHAAVTPAHLGEGFAVGLFFLLTAFTQSAWSCALLWKPERSLLTAGIAVNGSIVLVWLVSRTTGIPFVAGGNPEAVGLLDVAATTWELVLIVCCVRLLGRSSVPCSTPSWHRWPQAAQCWAAVSVGLLGALTLLDLHT